jgi:hypothetical protein
VVVLTTAGTEGKRSVSRWRRKLGQPFRMRHGRRHSSAPPVTRRDATTSAQGGLWQGRVLIHRANRTVTEERVVEASGSRRRTRALSTNC